MAYPRRRSYGGGGGIDLGALFGALYDAGVFGETSEDIQEAKRAKNRLAEIEKSTQGQLAVGSQQESFKKAQRAEEQRAMYDAFQAIQEQAGFNPGFLSAPQSILMPNFPSPLSIEAQGAAIPNIYGQQRIASSGLLSGAPQAGFEALQAGLSSDILNQNRPQALAIARAEANKKLGTETLAEESILDPEVRKNTLAAKRFAALREGSFRLPEGSADISAGGITQYTSPTEVAVPNPIIDPKTGKIIGYSEPTKLRQPGRLEQEVGRIPLDTNLYGPSGQRDVQISEVTPAGIPSSSRTLLNQSSIINKSYTIPKKSTGILPSNPFTGDLDEVVRYLLKLLSKIAPPTP